MPDLFDMKLRAQRRDRAARMGPEMFLFERAFDDCLDRLALVQRRFSAALLLGCPDPKWPGRLGEIVDAVEVCDPSSLFAQAAGGNQIVEDEWETRPAAYDLVLAIGTLDTVNDLPRALRSIATSMRTDAFCLGAISGGDTLPHLRSAMRAADQATGQASPHVHPRIEAAALAALLGAAGFSMPVVDVDRVEVSYPSFTALVADLRGMGATNVLTSRSRRPLPRAAYRQAASIFAAAGNGHRTVETYEILHFAAWISAPPRGANQG